MLKKARKERLIWIEITITLLALELMCGSFSFNRDDKFKTYAQKFYCG